MKRTKHRLVTHLKVRNSACHAFPSSNATSLPTKPQLVIIRNDREKSQVISGKLCSLHRIDIEVINWSWRLVATGRGGKLAGGMIHAAVKTSTGVDGQFFWSKIKTLNRRMKTVSFICANRVPFKLPVSVEIALHTHIGGEPWMSSDTCANRWDRLTGNKSSSGWRFRMN